MVGRGLGAALVIVLATAAHAAAQSAPFTGMVTGHIGAAARGDVREWTTAPGASVAVLDDNGFGAELDVSHARDFDTTLFADSSVTTVMLNALVMYPRASWRPFLVAGAGVMHVRVAFFPGQPATARTDTAWNAGGGLQYAFNELVAVRGDVRYFRHFGRQPGFGLGANEQLEFVRSSFGVALTWPVQ